LSCFEAARILLVSDRTFLGKRGRFEEQGFSGQWDLRLGKRPPNTLADEEDALLIKLYRSRYEGQILQIPPSTHRHHYAKVPVEVRKYLDGTLWGTPSPIGQLPVLLTQNSRTSLHFDVRDLQIISLRGQKKKIKIL